MQHIETRRELARYLQAQMAASRTGWLATGDDDDQEEASGKTRLKTYLVEAHCPSPGDELEALAPLGKGMGFSAGATKDAGLFRLATSSGDFWCDTSLGRFWRLHTTVQVKDADRFRDELVSKARWLDNVWLSPDYLEAFPAKVGAEMMTFSLHHDRRKLNPVGRVFSDSDYVSLRLWAARPEQTLAKLRGAEVFPHGVSVRSVQLRSGADEADGEFCVAEYFHHGKVTASGTSFDEHNRLVLEALKDYRATVEHIEQEYGLAATTDDAGRRAVVGKPIVIDVTWEVADLRRAVARMFKSTDPFRLWGLPEEVSERHFRAQAVDLHFGGVLAFDITPERVVIQLPRGVCGNTVVRFLSSLRRHVNSDARGPE